MKAFFITIVTLIISILTYNPLLGQTTNEKIDTYLQHLADHDKMMGSVAISQNGKLQFSKAYGYVDVEKGVKANENSIYRVGSITKVFTSILIHQLIDEARLSDSTTLDNYYPTVPNAKSITIGQMLQHSSGIYNFTNAEDYLDYNENPISKNDLVEKICSFEPDFAPGENSAYSNSAYVLLGFILEDIYDDSYANILEKRISKKLGLKYTRIGKPEINSSNNIANSYQYLTNWNKEEVTDMTVCGGAGAIVSTAQEVNKVMHALFQLELTSKSSLEDMIYLKNGFGKGLFAYPYNNERAYGHTGGIDGFRSITCHFPNGLTFTMLNNGENYIKNDIILAIFDIYNGQEVALPNLEKADVNIADWSPYEGVFESDKLPINLTFKEENNVLTAQGTGQPAFALEAVTDLEFKFDQAGVYITFDKNFNAIILKQGGADYEMIRKK